MKSKINELIQNFERKRKKYLEELHAEYEILKGKYEYHIEKRKVIFSKKAREYNKRFKIPLRKYIIPQKIRHLLSIPFIYSMIFPTVFLDLFLFIYQNTAVRLYWIPLVKRKDYVVFDRRHLDYLNAIQKVHCLYCSYVNGIFSFAVEVAGRTEKYWCPIKSVMRNEWGHNWEKHFADYGDPEWFKEVFNSTEEFKTCFIK